MAALSQMPSFVAPPIETAIDTLLGLLDAIGGDTDNEVADGCEDSDPGEADNRRNRMPRYRPDDQRVMVTAYAGREFEQRCTD